MSCQAWVLLLNEASSAPTDFSLMIDSFIAPKESSCQGIALLQKIPIAPKPIRQIELYLLACLEVVPQIALS